jgi:hypothetical protein
MTAKSDQDLEKLAAALFYIEEHKDPWVLGRETDSGRQIENWSEVPSEIQDGWKEVVEEFLLRKKHKSLIFCTLYNF